MNSEKEMLLGSDWTKVLGRVELEAVVKHFLTVESQANALRYYEGAVQASSVAEQLTAVSLLKETIRTIPGSNSAVQQLQGKLASYHQRLSNTVGMLSTGKPVPRKLHFVWVGGGIGAIQRDYINVWKQMTGPDGYRLNLWYDSDGLLAHETNRIIVESAKALGGRSSPDLAQEKSFTLGNRYVERARVLRRQMFEHIQKAVGAGESADQARINLLVSAYGQDEAALKALKARNLQSFEGLQANGIALRDIRAELIDQPLFDIYERELSFRGNLAGASDITRFQALNLESGTYLDTDLLPSLHEKIAGVDLANLDLYARIGVMQILLDHNRQILPNRGAEYADYRHTVPESFRHGLTEFAKKVTSITEIFAPFNDVLVAEHGLRVGNKNNAGDPTPFNGLSNAMLSGHAGSAALAGVFDKIRSNYAFLDRIQRLAHEEHISVVDPVAFPGLILREMERLHGPLSGWTDDLRARNSFLNAVASYDADGIKFGAQSAIVMSGPSAVSQGLNDFVNEQLITAARRQISDRVDLRDGFNLATEEETHHSWKDNAETEQDWLELETTRLKDGVYKNHYLGNVDELLKGQTLTFKRGWPVIEGKPVLLTSVLQQLLDELGEPFIRAMNDRLSGDIAFNDPFSIDFETRQQILKQPTSELPSSKGAESLGSLNEALARIAAGKLPLDQLSPLHRVVFGGLFGAAMLDQDGFAPAWESTVALAENTQDRGFAARYDLIEQALLSRDPAPFDAGLHGASSIGQVAQNSRVLKARALAEPLSVRQWGEHIARIETAAKHEYRASILQRGYPLGQRLLAAGAIAASQLPQELLVRGAGDPGRRCYPLALVMAAAVEKGGGALRTLIGKLANANLAPEYPESHALLRVLDELRGVPMAQFGEKLGPMSLSAAIRTLEAKTSTGSLMLNTPSHSLLVCKAVEAGATSYLFYDPNFGLYTFVRAADLQRGIEEALADRKLAGLYGIEDLSTTHFDLVALDGSRIADRALPSQVVAGDLLRSEPVMPWQHHAALRTRALSENARLGRSVAELEGMRWAQVIESATHHLLTSQSLEPDYVPLYETVKPTAKGQWTLSMINRRNPSKVLSVTVNDPRFQDIKNWLQERFRTMGEMPSEALPHGPEAINTLNTGFAILALMEILRQREGNGSTAVGASMTLAVRLHSYVIYSQLAHGVVSDVIGVIKLVRLALLDERLIAQTTSSVLSRTMGRVAGEGAGSLLALVNVGFDIYELATADNAPARAGAAVQLSFDVTAVALAGSAYAVGGSFAAFAGPLAVVVGAVGFGVGALARNYSAILVGAQEVGKYIYALKKAYREGGCKVEGGTLSPMSDAVINAIDLRTGTVSLGSQFLWGAIRPGPGLPEVGSGDSVPFNMRERWGLSHQFQLSEPVKTLILPCTPTCEYSYDYQLLPGATHRHDLGFDEARELERDSQGNRTFWFDPWTPFEYLVYKLLPRYRSTRVRVVLDEQCRSLYVPPMPAEWHGKLSYDIEAVTGQYSLSLTQGVAAVQLSTGHDSASLRWVIRATWLSDAQVSVDADGFKLGATEVHCVPGSELYLELERGQIYQMDWSNQRFTLLEQELPDENDASQLKKNLAWLNHGHRLASPYLPLHHFKVPLGDPLHPVHTNAWYEAAGERILYARDLPERLNAEVRLGAVMGDDVYFYHPDQPTLFRADALTGLVNRRYRLFNPRTDSTVVSCQELGEAIRVVQKVTDQEGVSYLFDYLVHMEKVELIAVSCTLDSSLPLDHNDFQWQGWNTFLKRFDGGETGDDASVSMGGDIKTWTTAKFISMQIHAQAQTWSAWVRSRDDWFVTGHDLGLPNPLLMASHRDDEDSMVFYDAGQKRLCVWQREAGAQGGVLLDLLNEVSSVVSVADGYLAQTDAGLVFDLRNAELTLRALSEQWLHKQVDWLKALATVAVQYGHHLFDVIGLSDAIGAPLYARYVEGRILLVSSEQAGNPHSLGRTPDKQAEWLFVPETGQVFRQPLMTVEQMSVLFGNATQLSRHDLPAPLQRVWREWSFAEVSVLGSGLQGRTHDGVILELNDGQPARITGVTREFVDAPGTVNTPQQRIASLIERTPHAPFLRAGSQQSVFTWYDSIARSLFSVDARSDGQWVTYLGKPHDHGFLMYDAIDRLLFSNDKKLFTHRISARRNGQVLMIESSDRSKALQSILMDEVDSLVLGFGHQGMTCQVSAADWSRLDCIVVDLPDLLQQHLDSITGSELAFEMQGLDHWQVVLAGEHLVLTDPDCGHSLIIRNARTLAATTGVILELKLHLWGRYWHLSVLELLNGWTSANVDGAPCELAMVLDASNEV